MLLWRCRSVGVSPAVVPDARGGGGASAERGMSVDICVTAALTRAAAASACGGRCCSSAQSRSSAPLPVSRWTERLAPLRKSPLLSSRLGAQENHHSSVGSRPSSTAATQAGPASAAVFVPPSSRRAPSAMSCNTAVQKSAGAFIPTTRSERASTGPQLDNQRATISKGVSAGSHGGRCCSCPRSRARRRRACTMVWSALTAWVCNLRGRRRGCMLWPPCTQ